MLSNKQVMLLLSRLLRDRWIMLLLTCCGRKEKIWEQIWKIWIKRRRNSTHLKFRWCPNWQVKCHRSLLNSPPRTRQKGTTLKASRQWRSSINAVINTRIHTYMSIIAIFPRTCHERCHVTKFAMQKWCDYSLNMGNLTKPSGRMVAGNVAVRAIMADEVLRWYSPGLRWCGGGGNPHGE